MDADLTGHHGWGTESGSYCEKVKMLRRGEEEEKQWKARKERLTLDKLVETKKGKKSKQTIGQTIKHPKRGCNVKVNITHITMDKERGGGDK